jgi:hypothetical protein
VAYGLALVVSSLSLWYARRQWLALRRLREHPDLPFDELQRERRQSWRRLASSGMLVLIAVLLVVAQIWLEDPAQRLAEARDRTDPPPAFTQEERDLARLWLLTWLAILVLLFAVIVLAFFDLWAIRRYGKRQLRKIQDDRQAMIARQLRRLRAERNGHDN